MDYERKTYLIKAINKMLRKQVFTTQVKGERSLESSSGEYEASEEEEEKLNTKKRKDKPYRIPLSLRKYMKVHERIAMTPISTIRFPFCSSRSVSVPRMSNSPLKKRFNSPSPSHNFNITQPEGEWRQTKSELLRLSVLRQKQVYFILFFYFF
jgi:hypothetical protein